MSELQEENFLFSNIKYGGLIVEAINNKQLVCPCCGSTDLAMATDRDIAGAVANGAVAFAVGGALGGISSAASNLKQQTFWVCKKCGNRFRNPKELKAEADMYQKRFKALMIFGGIVAVICLIASIAIFSTTAVVGVLFLLFAAFFSLTPLILRKKANDRYRELKEIEDGMRQFR